MDVGEFLGLQSTHNPHRWVMPIVAGISTADAFMFGGCGLGAAILAMEGTTGREVVWATAQYLSFARVGEIMDLDVTVAAAGRYTAQARVIGRVADREILTVNAAFGRRDSEFSGQWVEMPDVPPPDECEIRQNRMARIESIMSRVESRLAFGRQWDELDGTPSTSGRSALWVRASDLEVSAAMLAILGDYVPFGLSQTLGSWVRSNSLDNTLRVVKLVPSEWILLDVRVDGIDHGFGHGQVYQWAQDGTLLSSASQSAIVRGLVSPEALKRFALEEESGDAPDVEAQGQGGTR